MLFCKFLGEKIAKKLLLKYRELHATVASRLLIVRIVAHIHRFRVFEDKHAAFTKQIILPHCIDNLFAALQIIWRIREDYVKLLHTAL